MSLYESGQMYLETIYVLSKEKNFVRSIDVGEHMGYSKPSVSRAVSTLKKDGYITVGEDGGLQLTEKGLEVAQAMYERHTVLTKLLMGLGVEESVASEDACRMEHVLSEESFAAIKAHMEMYAK
ncbi:MAG: metal-dependent transcriptional regulator [Oscillospiraceae bacterium]|nr:metal-dependent transcriptional regulator [Oscillospiraceae bacterium]